MAGLCSAIVVNNGQMKNIHPSAEIHSTAIIYDGVTVEADVKIGTYCIIGAPAETKKQSHNLGVTIKSGTNLTGMVTVDSGSERTTIIWGQCLIMKGAHIGHDAIIGSFCTLSPGAKIGGHAELDPHCNIGMNATIHQRVKVPERCMIGMLTAVTRKIELKPIGVYVGTPARWIRENKPR